jgi:sensor histidine kinase regulating citrate/malate metabolism
MNMSLSMIILFLGFLLIMGLVYTMRIGDLYDDFTKSTSRLELAKKQISMQREYYATLSQQMNEMGKIEHEFDHFVESAIHFTEEGNFSKLKEYLSDYSEKAKVDSFVELSDHAVVNSMLRYYDIQAKENGILFENKCVIDSRITISDSDLCMILGNALDNAIDACKQLNSSKSRCVSIEAITMEDKWLIKVTNSYNGQLVIHDGRYLSSKSESIHGFGIRNIEQVIRAYGGIMQIEHNEKLFTLMAIVPINRNIDG